jgi:hypothetical protein
VSDVPLDAESFIAAYVGSVEELEIVLLLHAHPRRAWSAEGVANELRLDASSAAERLAEFARKGLVSHDTSGFTYTPPDTKAREGLAALARIYPTRRNAVIRLIFSRPNEKVQTFADAFRLRKDK